MDHSVPSTDITVMPRSLADSRVSVPDHVITVTRQKDPQIIVIDEVVGVLITLAASAPTWTSLVAGVVLFRIFDQWKPWPARSLESLHGGWGVVMDDVAAGVWGAVLLAGFNQAGFT